MQKTGTATDACNSATRVAQTERPRPDSPWPGSGKAGRRWPQARILRRVRTVELSSQQPNPRLHERWRIGWDAMIRALAEAGRSIRSAMVCRRTSMVFSGIITRSVSYTHLRAHETDSYLVCRLLLDKKKPK